MQMPDKEKILDELADLTKHGLTDDLLDWIENNFRLPVTICDETDYKQSVTPSDECELVDYLGISKDRYRKALPNVFKMMIATLTAVRDNRPLALEYKKEDVDAMVEKALEEEAVKTEKRIKSLRMVIDHQQKSIDELMWLTRTIEAQLVEELVQTPSTFHAGLIDGYETKWPGCGDRMVTYDDVNAKDKKIYRCFSEATLTNPDKYGKIYTADDLPIPSHFDPRVGEHSNIHAYMSSIISMASMRLKALSGVLYACDRAVDGMEPNDCLTVGMRIPSKPVIEKIKMMTSELEQFKANSGSDEKSKPGSNDSDSDEVSRPEAVNKDLQERVENQKQTIDRLIRMVKQIRRQVVDDLIHRPLGFTDIDYRGYQTRMNGKDGPVSTYQDVKKKDSMIGSTLFESDSLVNQQGCVVIQPHELPAQMYYDESIGQYTNVHAYISSAMSVARMRLEAASSVIAACKHRICGHIEYPLSTGIPTAIDELVMDRQALKELKAKAKANADADENPESESNDSDSDSDSDSDNDLRYSILSDNLPRDDRATFRSGQIIEAVVVNPCTQTTATMSLLVDGYSQRKKRRGGIIFHQIQKGPVGDV